MEVKVDIPLAKAYKSGLELILEELNLKDEIKLSHIMSLSEIIKQRGKS